MATTKKTTTKKSNVKETKKEVSDPRLLSLGIKEKEEEKVREKLIALLEKNDITNMEDSSNEELIDFAVSLSDDDLEEAEEAEETEEVEDYIEDEESVDEEEEEEEVVIEKPKKSDLKKSKKINEEEELDELIEEVKDTKIPGKTERSKRKDSETKKKKEKSGTRRSIVGTKFENLKTNKLKEEAISSLKKYFPENKFSFNLIKKGVVIKKIFDNMEQNILKLNRIVVLEDGSFESSFSSFKLKDISELEEYLGKVGIVGKNIKKGDGSSIYAYPVSSNEIFKILSKTDFIKVSIERSDKQNTKLSNNRKKLEGMIKENKKEESVKNPEKKEVKKSEAKPVSKQPVKKSAKKSAPEKKVVSKKKK